MAKRDKRDYIENLSEKAEEAAAQQDTVYCREDAQGWIQQWKHAFGPSVVI